MYNVWLCRESQFVGNVLEDIITFTWTNMSYISLSYNYNIQSFSTDLH